MAMGLDHEKARGVLLAFIDDAHARGLTDEQMADAIAADKALGIAAVLVILERETRKMIAEHPYPDDLPRVMDDSGLLGFLQRREGKKPTAE
jgi:hypothetical protein